MWRRKYWKQHGNFLSFLSIEITEDWNILLMDGTVDPSFRTISSPVYAPSSIRCIGYFERANNINIRIVGTTVALSRSANVGSNVEEEFVSSIVHKRYVY